MPKTSQDLNNCYRGKRLYKSHEVAYSRVGFHVSLASYLATARKKDDKLNGPFPEMT